LLKFCQVLGGDILIMNYKSIFVIIMLGIIAEVVRARNYHLLVNDDKLVVHQAWVAIQPDANTSINQRVKLGA
jgi:hypothetical protein